MAKKFGHSYELYVGLATELVAKHSLPTGFDGTVLAGLRSPNKLEDFRVKGYIDYLTIPKDVKLIKNPIQLDAEIKYVKGATSGSPQVAKIMLYNLSEDTVNSIVADAAVILKAGFIQDPELPIVFVGQVQSVSTEKVDADLITTMLCKDAGNVLKNVKFAGSYPKGQDSGFVIKQMLKKFAENGVPTGDFIESIRSFTQLDSSSSFSGSLQGQMTELCSSLGMVWYISKGKIYVQPKELDRLTERFDVSADQVIGSVVPDDDKAGVTSVDKAAKPIGVKLTTFLNGEIGLHTYMRVLYGKYEGDYALTAVTYKLNWKNGPWTVTVTSHKVKNYENNTT
jgi:hypothetical protein